MAGSSAPSSKGREKRLPSTRDKYILVPSSDQSDDDESAPVKSRPSSAQTSKSKASSSTRSHATAKMGSSSSRVASLAANVSKKRQRTVDETLVDGKDYTASSKRTRGAKNQLSAGQTTLSRSMGTLAIRKHSGMTTQEAIVISSDSDDLPRLIKNPSATPTKPRIPPTSSQPQASQSASDAGRSRRSTSTSTRASESPLKQGRAMRKHGCDERGWRPGQLTARELAVPKQPSFVKREPSQQSSHQLSSPAQRPVERTRPKVLVEETLMSPLKRTLPQEQGARKKERHDESIVGNTSNSQSLRTPRRDVIPESISYDASPTPTRSKVPKVVGGPLQDRDPGQQLPPPQPNFAAGKDDVSKRKTSGKKGRLSDLMVMDDESYRPPPSKSSAQRKSSKSSSRSAASSIARNRAHRGVAKPGMYEIPQMSAPLDMWIRKPSAPKNSLLSRPAHVSAPARLAEATTPRAAPKAAISKSAPAPRRQRSVSSELSPAPETQVARPLQRDESSLLSPAPPTPPAPASQRSAKVLPATPSRSRPSTQADPTPRPSQRERQEGNAAPVPKSPSPTESPPTDVAPGFDDIDDVLAEYADFAVSPTHSMISLASRRSINTPKTPRRQPTGSRLSASPLATRTHLPTPARSGANDAPPSSQTNTPAKSRTGMSLTSEIWREHERDLAGEDASREKARIQAEARWERQRQAAAMREEMDEEEELDFDLQFLDTLPEPAVEALDEAQEQPADGRRRSSRGRPTGAKSSATKPDREEQERLKSKKKDESAFKKLLNDRARDSARGRGEEAIGAALEALNSSPRGPDRGLGDAAWTGSEATGLELDDDTKAAAQLFMAERSAAASRERELSASTKVFWDETPTTETTPSCRAVLSTSGSDSVVELLRDVEDPTSLLATGILDAADTESIPHIADWLFTTAFAAESTELAWTAVSNLQQIMDTHDHHPFMTGERLFKRIESVWVSLGAKQEESIPLFDGTIQRSRDDASAILCVIIEAAVQKCCEVDRFTEADREGLILRLFALLAEPSTTATLLQQIAQTIGRILLFTPTQSIAGLAFKAADLVAPLPTQLQARAVLALGRGTSVVRQLVRWLAMSLILPEIRGEKEQPPSVVDMDLLQQGLDHIQDLMPDGTTDYWPASDTFTLWSLALGDESEEASGSADDTRRHLNRLLHSIRDKAQEGPAASLKGRMDQLKHVLKLQDDKRQGRRGKQTDATSWLFGEERGQTKLSFAPAGGV